MTFRIRLEYHDGALPATLTFDTPEAWLVRIQHLLAIERDVRAEGRRSNLKRLIAEVVLPAPEPK